VLAREEAVRHERARKAAALTLWASIGLNSNPAKIHP
jgi:hypothetical protein